MNGEIYFNAFWLWLCLCYAMEILYFFWGGMGMKGIYYR